MTNWHISELITCQFGRLCTPSSYGAHDWLIRPANTPNRGYRRARRVAQGTICIRGVFIDLNANCFNLLYKHTMEEDIMYRVIASVLICVAASPIYAQQAEVLMLNNGQITSPENFYTPPQEQVNEKNPWIAFLLSTAIAGSGQFYNEQYSKGSAMFIGAATGIGMYFYSREDNYTNQISFKHIDRKDNDSMGTAGAGLALGFIVWSMIDAPLTSIEINRRNQQAVTMGPVISRDRLGIVFSLNLD